MPEFIDSAWLASAVLWLDAVRWESATGLVSRLGPIKKGHIMGRRDLMSMGARSAASGTVNVIVETPAGSRNKFKFDEDAGIFWLHKILPLGATFPFDFGFVPGTRAEDGDPLDMLVLGEEPTFTGCLVTVRLLGIIEAEQTEKGTTIRNDRLVGTAETPKIRPAARSLGDVPARLLDQIEHFFIAYNRFEGRRFVPTGRRGPRVAAKRIEQGVSEYLSFQKRAPRERRR